MIAEPQHGAHSDCLIHTVICKYSKVPRLSRTFLGEGHFSHYAFMYGRKLSSDSLLEDSTGLIGLYRPVATVYESFGNEYSLLQRLLLHRDSMVLASFSRALLDPEG